MGNFPCGFLKTERVNPFYIPSMDITESNARREGCLERLTRIELVSVAWKATAQPNIPKTQWCEVPHSSSRQGGTDVTRTNGGIVLQ